MAHIAGNKTVNPEDSIAEDVLLSHRQTHYFLWCIFPVGLLFAYPMDFDSQKSIITSESNKKKMPGKIMVLYIRVYYGIYEGRSEINASYLFPWKLH